MSESKIETTPSEVKRYYAKIIGSEEMSPDDPDCSLVVYSSDYDSLATLLAERDARIADLKSGIGEANERWLREKARAEMADQDLVRVKWLLECRVALERSNNRAVIAERERDESDEAIIALHNLFTEVTDWRSFLIGDRVGAVLESIRRLPAIKRFAVKAAIAETNQLHADRARTKEEK